MCKAEFGRAAAAALAATTILAGVSAGGARKRGAALSQIAFFSASLAHRDLSLSSLCPLRAQAANALTYDELQGLTYLQVKGTGVANTCSVIAGGSSDLKVRRGGVRDGSSAR